MLAVGAVVAILWCLTAWPVRSAFLPLLQQRVAESECSTSSRCASNAAGSAICATATIAISDDSVPLSRPRGLWRGAAPAAGAGCAAPGRPHRQRAPAPRASARAHARPQRQPIATFLASDELLAARGVTLHEINRGGDVTYHGPGQLIGYPIFDLRSLRNPSGHNRLGPVDFVRLMEEASHSRLRRVWRASRTHLRINWRVVRTSAGHCPRLKVRHATKANDSPRGRKIAAIGIHVARGVTSHGFAFNVTTDLRDFALINPCGITDRPVTSLEREAADCENAADLESLAHGAARHFGWSSTSRSSSLKASPRCARLLIPRRIRRPANSPHKTRRSRFRRRSSACATQKTAPSPHKLSPGRASSLVRLIASAIYNPAEAIRGSRFVAHRGRAMF